MADKKAKSAVGYKLGGDHCGACKHFIEGEGEDGSCELVAGTIGEDMWCKLFSRTRSTIAGGGYRGG